MGSRVKLFIPLILFVILALFLFRGLSLDPKALPSALIDHPLPEFSLPELGRDRQLTQEDVVGQVVFLNIRATWCISCRVEQVPPAPLCKKLSERERRRGGRGPTV